MLPKNRFAWHSSGTFYFSNLSQTAFKRRAIQKSVAPHPRTQPVFQIEVGCLLKSSHGRAMRDAEIPSLVTFLFLFSFVNLLLDGVRLG